jgi:hypothetical protein
MVMAGNLEAACQRGKLVACHNALKFCHAVMSCDVANRSMARKCPWVGLVLAAVVLAAFGSAATAEPRLERERCVFKPPRGDHLECFVLVVPEDRSRPEGREVKLRGVILKAKRGSLAEPVVYLSGGPGDTPLVASEPGVDALIEGDWWKDTAALRRRRDVIIISQRGAGGATPDLVFFIQSL